MKTTSTVTDLQAALAAIQEKYNNNIGFAVLENQGRQTRFRLRVLDSKGHGAAKAESGRRTGSACWHVHGDFFDALFSIDSGAVVFSRGGKITSKFGNWADFNVGSQMHPKMASECCECSR